MEDQFFVERRRIVLLDENQGMEGGLGIVRRAELHHSAYLPTRLVSRQFGPPQIVAVKQIKISAVSNLKRVKRVGLALVDSFSFKQLKSMFVRHSRGRC